VGDDPVLRDIADTENCHRKISASAVSRVSQQIPAKLRSFEDEAREIIEDAGAPA
jgi:hypothetical protein